MLEKKFTIKLISFKKNSEDKCYDAKLSVKERKTGKVDDYSFTTWKNRPCAEPWFGYFDEEVDKLVAQVAVEKISKKVEISILE